MRAAVYHGPKHVEVEEVPDPRIEEPTDVIVKTRASSMCGSDLYLYQGEVPDMVTPGHTTLGHEIAAEVVEVGPDVSRFQVGDRVTFPYSVSCGSCFFCRHGQTAHCATSGKAIYGYGVAFGDLGGSQAEYVRVPLADGHLEKIPESITDDQAVFLSCNLPAAVIAANAADLASEDRVAIVGAGPTGLLALQLAARITDAPPLVLDRVGYRLDRAQELGGEPMNIDEGDTVARVQEATGGLGVDKVIEFAGRGDAFTLATQILRPGGTLAGGGVYLEQDHPVSLFTLYFNNLQLRLNGFANAHTAMAEAAQLVEEGAIDPTTVISHRVGLDDVPAAARSFSERDDGFFKMLIQP